MGVTIILMFSLAVLGSGSAGNAMVVATERTRVLIDAGLSARQLRVRLDHLGVNPESLDGVLLTHEHIDHAQGLRVFLRGNNAELPVYCNRDTAAALQTERLPEHRNWKIFGTGSAFSIGDLTFESFSVPHDACDPVGFVIHHGAGAAAYATDFGFATGLIKERLREVHTLVIETNHDERLLQDDPHRPWPVKQRIMSRHGHLSNGAAAALVSELLGSALRRVVVSHLSRDCNTPELSMKTVREKLAVGGAENAVEVLASLQRESTAFFSVGTADLQPDFFERAPVG